ncbi:MAG: extradiol ring-cleavage dioxygenase [Firmicutes bacterium]|nr:extradiol ring-cleavage dioxygenase [Bacillota bacterium]
MAHLVAAAGVPHPPRFPELARRQGADSEILRLYGEVGRQLRQAGAEVLLILDSDHFNTFFLNNFPTFAIGVAPLTAGPNEPVPGLERTAVPVAEEMGNTLWHQLVRAGFDLAVTQEFEVDHSIMVPLHFLTPSFDLPILPLFVNGLLPPLPSARRCYQLGQALRHILESLPADTGVALLASGSISLEVGGPLAGRIDHQWMDTVLSCLSRGAVEELLNQATAERMRRAGNVSGELLNWIAVWGATAGRTPTFLQPQAGYGHAFAVWRWD